MIRLSHIYGAEYSKGHSCERKKLQAVKGTVPEFLLRLSFERTSKPRHCPEAYARREIKST
jgi:hypothetical protein